MFVTPMLELKRDLALVSCGPLQEECVFRGDRQYTMPIMVKYSSTLSSQTIQTAPRTTVANRIRLREYWVSPLYDSVAELLPFASYDYTVRLKVENRLITEIEEIHNRMPTSSILREILH